MINIDFEKYRRHFKGEYLNLNTDYVLIKNEYLPLIDDENIDRDDLLKAFDSYSTSRWQRHKKDFILALIIIITFISILLTTNL